MWYTFLFYCPAEILVQDSICVQTTALVHAYVDIRKVEMGTTCVYGTCVVRFSIFLYSEQTNYLSLFASNTTGTCKQHNWYMQAVPLVHASSTTGTCKQHHWYMQDVLLVPASINPGTCKQIHWYMQAVLLVPASSNPGTCKQRHWYMQAAPLVHASSTIGTCKQQPW